MSVSLVILTCSIEPTEEKRAFFPIFKISFRNLSMQLEIEKGRLYETPIRIIDTCKCQQIYLVKIDQIYCSIDLIALNFAWA